MKKADVIKLNTVQNDLLFIGMKYSFNGIIHTITGERMDEYHVVGKGTVCELHYEVETNHPPMLVLPKSKIEYEISRGRYIILNTR